MEQFKLWGENSQNNVIIEYYPPMQKSTDVAVVVFPGGGYTGLAKHEGEGYARLLNTFGITAFVVYYRVNPNCFPLPLMDARRAMRFVRANAEKFGINKEKVLAMGSSAGGHLTALLSTYLDDIGEKNDELLNEKFLPNGQILCYPVVSSDEAISHRGSFEHLLAERYSEKEKFSPDLLVNSTTPPAFIWHTADDPLVPCVNSYRYATALWKEKISCELHVFPKGRHGLGVAPDSPHVAQWTDLLKNWLRESYQKEN